MTRKVASLGVGLVLAAALAAGLLVTSGTAAQAAPAFTLPALGGGAPVTVPVRQGGVRMPMVITFFASWCGPCRGELPAVATQVAAFQASGTRVAFIGIDGNDDPGSGLAFARRSGVRFPVGADAASAVAPRFGIPGYPATAFVDARGDVVKVVRGPISVATLRTWTDRIALPRHAG